MKTRIREVRKAKQLTLEEVAARCVPPTTAQTIGRLETGMRTVSVNWLNRIADALEVEASALVDAGTAGELQVAAILAGNGTASAPRRTAIVAPPRPREGLIAVTVSGGVGDYRAGDEIWCESLMPADYHRALNRDVLVPRPAGRFLFGRLIGREGGGGQPGKLHLLPPGAGGRQQVIADPAWIAMAVKLVRPL